MTIKSERAWAGSMEKLTYENAMKRLEEIVTALEDGNISLDDSLKLFEEGTRLSAHCMDCINKAEQRIIELSKIEKAEDESVE